MKSFILLLSFVCLTSIARADVSASLFEEDGITLFDYRDIPVGTELTVVVSSDITDLWSGELAMANESIALGSLSPHNSDFDQSVNPEAGIGASVNIWEQSDVEGFILYAGNDPLVGNWFILDFTALSPGICNVGFYDFNKGEFYEPGISFPITITPEPMTVCCWGWAVQW